MKIQPEVENYYISLIRSMRAKKPNATITEIGKALNAQDIRMGEPYLIKLFHRVDDIVRKNALFENKAVFLAPIIERLGAVREVLWGIILDPKATHAVKVFAADKLMKADQMLQDSVYNSGLLEKHLGKLDIAEAVEGEVSIDDYLRVAQTMEHFGVVTPNQRKVVQAAILRLAGEGKVKDAQIIKKYAKPKRKKYG